MIRKSPSVRRRRTSSDAGDLESKLSKMLSLNNVRRLLAEQSEHTSTGAARPDDDDGFGKELSELNAIETRLSEELAQFRLFYQADSECIDDETCTIAIDESLKSLSSADYSFCAEEEDTNVAASTSSAKLISSQCYAPPVLTPSPPGMYGRDYVAVETVVLDRHPKSRQNICDSHETIGSKWKAGRQIYSEAVRELQDLSSPQNTHVFDPIQPRRCGAIIECQERRRSESVKELQEMSHNSFAPSLDPTAGTGIISTSAATGEADQDGKDVSHYAESLSRALAYLKQANGKGKVALDETRLIAAIAYLRLRRRDSNKRYNDMKGIMTCFAGFAFDRHEYKTRALFCNGKLWDGEFVRTVEGTVCIYIAASIVAATSFDNRSAMHVWSLLCLPPLVTILVTATPHEEDEVSMALSALCLKAIGN
eukprot:CAMPEP_0196823756 /NCGR_PEP_ID=MMETSP1362-20130617/88835_1 /TAXON_ID=163516 /ORGANISM="Leptocylindrus danicus, Strain CCMP1856" /LENGTH=423 /DNA_ID=CAMNT_0042203737 /DNA_START=70 /DNA_END=1338 /DNA_ORIENTATION=+